MVGKKIIPHFPWEILTIFTLYSSNCYLISPVNNLTAIRKWKIFIAHIYFSPFLYYYSRFWKCCQVLWSCLKLAGKRMADWLFKTRKEVISVEKVSTWKKILLSYVYPIQGTPCCLVHEVKSVQAKMEITQPALSLYPNPSRQLLNCCCSWNSKGDQGGSNLITHLHEKFRPPPVLRAPH